MYLTGTTHTRTQLTHATFIDRKHHGSHIPFLLNQQLKSCAREIDANLNSTKLLQSALPHTRLAAIHHNHINTPNLMDVTSIYLNTYGIHLRDVCGHGIWCAMVVFWCVGLM